MEDRQLRKDWREVFDRDPVGDRREPGYLSTAGDGLL